MTTLGKILTGFILIAILAIGGYLIYRPLQSDTIPVTSTTVPTQPTEGKKMAFTQAAEQGHTAKCSVTYYTGDTPHIAMVYLGDKMVRAQFGDVSFVTRDGSSYGWDSATATVGTKVTASTTEGGYTLASYQFGDYTCEDWTTNASLFTVPATIQFNLSI